MKEDGVWISPQIEQMTQSINLGVQWCYKVATFLNEWLNGIYFH